MPIAGQQASDRGERAALPSGDRSWGVAMKVRDAIRLIEADGWRCVVVRGSHRQFKHPEKAGRVTISGHRGDDMPKGTLASVLRQARIDRGGS
jgi:predicted RNA binding protein YcfA (HicA-like mRNA interferase family)